jgi:hypothetical protein
MLSVLWVVCVSMWFFQHVPEVNGPGIASVYLQCIGERNAKRRECRARSRMVSRRGAFRVPSGLAVDGARSNRRSLGTRLRRRVNSNGAVG